MKERKWGVSLGSQVMPSPDSRVHPRAVQRFVFARPIHGGGGACRRGDWPGSAADARPRAAGVDSRLHPEPRRPHRYARRRARGDRSQRRQHGGGLARVHRDPQGLPRRGLAARAFRHHAGHGARQDQPLRRQAESLPDEQPHRVDRRSRHRIHHRGGCRGHYTGSGFRRRRRSGEPDRPGPPRADRSRTRRAGAGRPGFPPHRRQPGAARQSRRG